MKKTSVVILNWNGKDLLSRFVPSILEYTDLTCTDIVVADNASTDSSIDYISKQFPEIQQINLPDNYGFAKGYNEALKRIDSEYVVLLNSDVEVTSNWLEPIIDFLDTNKDVAAVQPKILSFKNKEYFEYAGASGGFIDKLGYPFCRGRIFGELEKDLSQYNSIVDIFWVSGACMIIRLDDFNNAGGLDDSFFAHMEEIDLCWRLNARGKRLVCIPDSIVYHVGGATLASESPQKTFLNFRNNLLMLYKNLPEKVLKSTLATRRVLDYIASIQMLVSGKKGNAAAIIKAHKEFKRIKPQYTSKRKENIEKTVSSEIKTIFTKSILWSYYIKRLKQFNKIRF